MRTKTIDDRIHRFFPAAKRRVSRLLLLLLLSGATLVSGCKSVPRVQDDVVCRVNGSEIHRGDVETQKQKLLPAASFHGSVDPDNQQAMRRSALQRLIGDELEYQDAKQRAISVDHERVAREYSRLADRYGGKRAFEARIKRSGIAGREIKAALEREFLISMAAERVAEDLPEIRAEDTRRYFAEHAASFQLPRRAEARQILITLPPLEREPDDWKHAVEQANALRRRVEAGESFATLLGGDEHRSETERVEGRRLGVVHPGQLKSPLDAVLWSLQPGEVSEPIRAFKGVYLLFVDNFIEARALAYDEIDTQLVQLLRKKRREQALNDWRSALREQANIEILDPSLAPLTE